MTAFIVSDIFVSSWDQVWDGPHAPSGWLHMNTISCVGGHSIGSFYICPAQLFI